MSEIIFEWTDELVTEFCHMLGQGPYGVFKGAHKLEDKIRKFKQWKHDLKDIQTKYY